MPGMDCRALEKRLLGLEALRTVLQVIRLRLATEESASLNPIQDAAGRRDNPGREFASQVKLSPRAIRDTGQRAQRGFQGAMVEDAAFCAVIRNRKNRVFAGGMHGERFAVPRRARCFPVRKRNVHCLSFQNPGTVPER